MAGTLLDLLGLTDPAAALMAASTGGVVAPAGAAGAQTQAASADNGTGGAAAPADPFAALVALIGKKRGTAVAPELARAGQSLDNAAPAAVKAAADKWGGKVLGFGATEGKGKFATVLRDGMLFHVYADPRKNQKMDSGSVAEALGIKAKQGKLVRATPADVARSQRNGNGTGGAMAPADLERVRGRLQGIGRTGGAMAPTFDRQQPGPGPGETMEGNYSRGPELSEQHRVPLDPLTGGVLAPETDGTAQAASATTGDVPMTAAEAYRRRLMAAHARLGL